MLSCNHRISEVKIQENMVLSAIIQKCGVILGSYNELSLFGSSKDDAHNGINILPQNSISKSTLRSRLNGGSNKQGG